MNADPFREIAAAMRTRTGFDAITLKFTKGKWTAGKDAVSMDGAELVALVHLMMFGWVLWQDKKPVDYRIGFVADRFKPPPRSKLPDPGDGKWEMSFLLPLTDDLDDVHMYTGSSQGAKDALADLQEEYADHRAKPDQAHKVPRVRLVSSFYPHPKYGRVDVPVLQIIGWVDPPSNPKIAKIKPPAPAVALLTDASSSTSTDVIDIKDEIPF
jgi:hypothetical protein